MLMLAIRDGALNDGANGEDESKTFEAAIHEFGLLYCCGARCAIPTGKGRVMVADNTL
jgi:hypothetical protein